MSARHRKPEPRVVDAPGLKTYSNDWSIETYLASEERVRLGLPRPAHALPLTEAAEKARAYYAERMAGMTANPFRGGGPR